MPNLLEEVRSVLEAAGYITLTPRPDSVFLHFEDISIMGDVQTLASADDIVAQWETIQDEFLRNNATRFLRDATKAWNLYTILLTEEPATGQTSARLFAIEEDFRGTRKLARAGVASRGDLLAALAPLLPIQNVLSVGLSDAKQRLVDRLGTSNPALGNLTTDERPESIAAALLGAE